MKFALIEIRTNKNQFGYFYNMCLDKTRGCKILLLGPETCAIYIISHTKFTSRHIQTIIPKSALSVPGAYTKDGFGHSK